MNSNNNQIYNIGYTGGPSAMVNAPHPEAPSPMMDDEGNPIDEELQQLNKLTHKKQKEKQEWDKGTRSRLKSLKNVLVKVRERPDPQELKRHLNKTHPRNKYSNPYKCCEACCQFDVGYNTFCCTTKKKDADKFGMGVSLYFKFLKSTLWFIFILILMNSILTLIYNRMYSESGDDSLFDGEGTMTLSLRLKEFWTSISIGGFASASNRFYEYELTDTPTDLTLSCSKGTLSLDPDTSYYGLLEKDNTAIYTMYQIDSTCNNEDVFMTAVQSCEDQKECTVSFSNLWFNSDCLESKKSTHKLYLKMYCQKSKLTLFNRTYTKEQYSWLIFVVNFLTLLFFLIFLLNQKFAESRTVKYHIEEKSTPSNYSLQIKNLPQGIEEQQMIDELYDHLIKYAKYKKLSESKRPIVDITMAQSNEMIIINKKIADQEETISYAYEKIKNQKYMKNIKLPRILDMSQLKSCIDHKVEKKNRRKAKKDFKKLLKKARKKKEYEAEKETLALHKNEITRAFVIFRTIQIKNLFVKAFQTSSCSRCQLKCSNSKKYDIRKYRGKVLKVEQPPEPININWENMTYTGKNKFFRRSISWGLSILLFIAFVGITIYLSLEVADKETKSINCPAEKGTISEADVISDYLNDNLESKAYCYCTEDFSGRLNQSFNVNGESKKICFDIYNEILQQVLYSFIIAVLLTISSMAIDKLLKSLSSFEKYTDLNEMFSSRILKGFLMKYGNSGVLIFIINLKIRLFSSLALGTYDDLTPNWYATIGYSVVFTYILKFFTFIGWTFYRAFVPWCRRKCDRGCSNNIAKTKKKTMAEYIALYMGNEFDIDYSYTEILKAMFVCFSFGTILPIVYVISFIHLILLYYRDKVYMLRLYRFPPAFDERMNKKVRRILAWCIPLYCISAIWVFGNPNILEKTNIINFDAQSYAENYTKRDLDTFFAPIIIFFNRAVTLYGAPFFAILLVFLLIFIMGFIFSNTFGLVFSLLFGCCKVDLKKAQLKKDMWFDARMPISEMGDEVDLYISLLEKKWFKSKRVKKLTEVKLKMYLQMLQNPEKLKKVHKFETLSSYNFRLNPNYKYLFIHKLERLETQKINY